VQRWTRWGNPKPQQPQQEPAGQRTVYLPEPVYPPIPAPSPAQPARQQGGTIAERERISAELAILARPQRQLFAKREAFERAALARLKFRAIGSW
jgi:hypothetical protein